MTVATGNNVAYGSGLAYFYDARIEYVVTYPNSTQYQIDWELYVYHSTSMYDTNNNAKATGDLKNATYGSKTYSSSGAGTKSYASGTKTGTRLYSNTPNVDQVFYIENLADGSGGGGRSTVSVSIPITDRPASAPSTPAAPSNTSVTQSGVTVNMTLPANNGATITKTYFYIYAAASGGLPVASYTSTSAATSRAFTGLSPTTNYWSAVKAENSAGVSAESARTPFTTSAAVAPDAPPDPVFSAITTSGGTITMALPANMNGATFTAYNLMVLTLADAVILDTSQAGTTYALTGRSPGEQVKVKYRINSTGGYSDWSNEEILTMAPGAPLAPVLTHLSNYGTGGRFSNTVPDARGSVISGYTLQVSTDPLFGSTVYNNTSAITVQDAQHPNDTDLHARVRAESDQGPGAWSAIVSFHSWTGLYYNDAVNNWQPGELWYNDPVNGWDPVELEYTDAGVSYEQLT